MAHFCLEFHINQTYLLKVQKFLFQLKSRHLEHIFHNYFQLTYNKKIFTLFHCININNFVLFSSCWKFNHSIISTVRSCSPRYFINSSLDLKSLLEAPALVANPELAAEQGPGIETGPLLNTTELS